MDINSLERFVKAQELAYPIALQDIKKGKNALIGCGTFSLSFGGFVRAPWLTNMAL